MTNDNRQLHVALERNMLQRYAGTRLKPSIRFSWKPVVEVFFQSIQHVQRRRPSDLHSQIFRRFSTTPGVHARSTGWWGSFQQYCNITDLHEFRRKLVVEIVGFRSITANKDSLCQCHEPASSIFTTKNQLTAKRPTFLTTRLSTVVIYLNIKMPPNLKHLKIYDQWIPCPQCRRDLECNHYQLRDRKQWARLTVSQTKTW